MRFWKWTLSLTLMLVLAACGTTPAPTFSPPPTRGAYPGPFATLPAGYPAPNETAQGYPAPAARATVTSGAPGSVFVTYKDFEIVPKQITITVGATVTFLIESASGAHHRPYNADPPNVFEAPADLGNGAQFSHTFTQPGMITIRCRYHDTMTATITVTP